MTPRLKQALDQAAVWHAGQSRKYPGVDVPYVSHLAGVAITLTRHRFDEDVVVAGVLHDAVEDTEATLGDIEAGFGPAVAALVEAVTEPDRSAPWEVRKAEYLVRFARNPWPAQAISLADKIDNLHSIVVCAELYGDPWPMFSRGRGKQLERFAAMQDAAHALPPHPLVVEFDAALAAVVAL